MSPAQHIENCNKRQSNNPFVEQFRAWLKHQLNSQEVSMRSLAQAVGIHHANLSTLWTRWNPSIKAMNRIAQGLGYRLELSFVPLSATAETPAKSAQPKAKEKAETEEVTP